jgi:hypothetical protein
MKALVSEMQVVEATERAPRRTSLDEDLLVSNSL